MSLEQIIEAAQSNGRITRCDSEITTTNFPKTEIRVGLTAMSLTDLGLDPDEWYLSFQVIEAMEANGYRPGNMIELAHHAATNWDLTTGVAALGEIWINQENLAAAMSGMHMDYIPTRFAGELLLVRNVHLWLGLFSFPTSSWTERYRPQNFLVVPSV